MATRCLSQITIRPDGGLESASFRCRVRGVHFEHKWWLERDGRFVVDVSWPVTDADEDVTVEFTVRTT
jgi:hypothetical protein